MIKKTYLNKVNLTACLISILLTTSNAFSESPALDFDSLGTGADYYQGSYSLGWNFTANKNINVTALGFYDDLKNGLAESHSIGIYDLSCQLLASATVSPSDTLSGFFRFKDITPVTLHEGTQYYIAALTGTEKYAISVTTLNVDPAITFNGFSIFGFTQQTASLQCPNGSQSVNFHGDFGPTFRFADTSTGSPGEDNKRETALSLFCNRSGSNLETAKCTATLADKGAPPRSLPTGAINFEATAGFFPASASCFAQQTPFSPGIGSCEVQFAVPAGFLIGAKFPINATYAGDANFKTSSTSHKLIIPACVGTTTKPCPNSVGLSFDTYPQLLKDKLSVLIACGSGKSKAAVKIRRSTLAAETPPAGGVCSVSGTAALNVKDLFTSLTFEDATKIGEQIDDSAAKKDTLLYYLQQAKQVQTAERWKILQQNQEALFKIQQDVTSNGKFPTKSSGNPYDVYINYLHIAAAQIKPKFDKSLKTEAVVFDIKPDKQKAAKFKLTPRMKTLAAAFRKAGVSTLPLEINLKVKQKKRRGSATVFQSVDVAVN